MPSDLDITRRYHQRTKHQRSRFARALGYMAWDTQPDPFRVYRGSPRVNLSLLPPESGPGYEEAMVEGRVTPALLGPASISRLFQDALGLSAWKQAGGARWSLRVNPSSGNLHPTEGYLVSGPVEGLSAEAGVWHYQPHDHCLEQRLVLPSPWWAQVQSQVPAGAVLVGLTSIYVRESWKYGERAFRYCQHDVGHALAALSIAAAGLGWTTRLLETVMDADLARLLGISDQTGPEAEHPDLLLLVFPQGGVYPRASWQAFRLPELSARDLDWYGAPERLASEHQPWPVIDEVHQGTTRQEIPDPTYWATDPTPFSSIKPGDPEISLRSMVHQRRSAVEMDGSTGITLREFIQNVSRVLPGKNQVPFAALPWSARVHLLIFVHRVEGLEPGMYCLVRDLDRLEFLQTQLYPEGNWSKAKGCPEHFPLYLLAGEDCRYFASSISCGQAIAADGAYAMAMLAEFREPLETWGAWFYKRLHWESGVVGQLLYLEAEAIGIRATGIGCFFDDYTHEVAELTGDGLQDIYHFTVGGPLEDERLASHPPYEHLKR